MVLPKIHGIGDHLTDPNGGTLEAQDSDGAQVSAQTGETAERGGEVGAAGGYLFSDDRM